MESMIKKWLELRFEQTNGWSKIESSIFKQILLPFPNEPLQIMLDQDLPESMCETQVLALSKSLNIPNLGALKIGLEQKA